MEERWRKSTRSGGEGGNCVELACRKSSRSGGTDGNCVELASAGLLRDSKNPTGPKLAVTVAHLVAAVKRGQLG